MLTLKDPVLAAQIQLLRAGEYWRKLSGLSLCRYSKLNSFNVAIPEDARKDCAQEAPQWGHQNAEQNNNTEQELSCNSPSVQHLSDWTLPLVKTELSHNDP